MTESYERFRKSLALVGRKPPCDNAAHVMSSYECYTCGVKSPDYLAYTPPVTFDISPMETAPKNGEPFEVLERREIKWEEYRDHHISRGPAKNRGASGRWVTSPSNGYGVKYNGNALGWFKNADKTGK